jgi:hypothetical protein
VKKENSFLTSRSNIGKVALLSTLFLCFFIVSTEAIARSEFPNLSGEVFLESRAGFVNSESSPNTYSNSFMFNIEPKFSLNINEEWSVKTQWKISPVKDRRSPNYNIGNVFPSTSYPDSIDDYGLVVEEIKGDFKNEAMNFFLGKYNPTFGKAWKRERRMGVFTRDFTEDYELRENLALGLAALLDDGGAITLNLFFNDTTGMSNSAINRRGKNKSSNNVAGNNNNLSSYSITAAGNNFFEIEDLSYNFGYRDLDVENESGVDNEKGFVAGLEYKIPINYKTFFVPFFEIVKLNNFEGVGGQDIIYTTTSLAINYSNWSAGVGGVLRDIKRRGTADFTDTQTHYFVGYNFRNGINLDVAHTSIKENNNKAKIVGIAASYLFKF